MPRVRIIKEQRKTSKEAILLVAVVIVSMAVFVALAGFLLIHMLFI